MIIIEKSSGSQLKTVWHGTHMKANPIILTSRLGPSLVGSQKVTLTSGFHVNILHWTFFVQKDIFIAMAVKCFPIFITIQNLPHHVTFQPLNGICAISP